ncbi:mediator of RNA polymerase II transcription subunit 29-like [Littorina saxatilis]|uniref:Mediator of RNA polymerase II transcription subunit 29 n=1 Tax=Littorina saxatilis TaxID=31220 RepID=A0AAN9BFW1_9CAEN
MASAMQQQMPNPQQQASGGQQQPQQAQQGDLDPVSRFKILLPRLKESLVSLFRDAGQVFKINAARHDSGSMPDSQQRERCEKFEKRLEDFCGICDQIEVSLRLALELHHQAVDSMKNTPLTVMISKPDPNVPQQEGQSYAQYLTTMRQQINYAKEIHDLLHESATKLMEKSQPQPPPPPPQQQLQQQHTPTQQPQQD